MHCELVDRLGAYVVPFQIGIHIRIHRAKNILQFHMLRRKLGYHIKTWKRPILAETAQHFTFLPPFWAPQVIVNLKCLNEFYG